MPRYTHLNIKTEAAMLKFRKGATAGLTPTDYERIISVFTDWRFYTTRKAKQPVVYTITAPNGDHFEWAREQGYRVHTAHELLPWLKAHGLVEAVCQMLGLDPIEEETKKRERQRMADERRATCPCCFRGIKYQPDIDDVAGSEIQFDTEPHRKLTRIVKHGYTQEPGRGAHITPDCFGAGFKPFEVSTEGTRALLAHLMDRLVGLEARLGEFDRGEVKTLFIQVYVKGQRFPSLVEINDTDPRWARSLASHHDEMRWKVRRTRETCWELATRIANWKPEPLPR